TVLIACVVLYLLWRRRFYPDAVALIVAGWGGSLLNELLKRSFHRNRPEPAFYRFGYSFPSGHAMSSVIVYGFLAYLLSREVEGRWRMPVWASAILMVPLVG